MTMKLAFSPTSPYVRKVLVCAHELGLIDQIENEAVTVLPTLKNDEYATQNPLGKVPALTLNSGEVIYDSGVICEYLDSLSESVSLIPQDQSRWAVLTQHQLASGIKDALVLMRYETVLRPENCRWDEWLEGQKRKAYNAIRWFEQNPDSLAAPLNFAQIGLACALSYWNFRFAELPWQDDHPKLQAWHSHFRQRASMLATAHD